MEAITPARVRCAIYVRISEDRSGEELGITRQLEDCRKIAEEKGWEVTAEYKDNSISAYQEKNRPEYQKMAAAYEAGDFGAVIVWDLDRFTRQPKQLEDWVEAAEKRGLLFATASGDIDLSTDNGRMHARIKAAVARSEMERKAARQKRAARQRAEQGKTPSGRRLTGYTTDGQVIEAEAATVREVYSRFFSGDTIKGITRHLTESGVPTRNGRPWNPSSITRILTNPRYCGRIYYARAENGTAGDWYPADAPAIIEEHVWDTVNARLANPRRKSHGEGTHRRNLGSSLYQCGVCDRPVRSHSTGGGGGYRCPDGHVSRSAPPIDREVITVTRLLLGKPEVARLVKAPQGKQVSAATAEIQKQRGRLVQVERDYDEELIDGRRYKVKRAKIEAELAAAEARLTRATAGAEVAGVVLSEEPVKAFDDAPIGIRQSVIRYLMIIRLHHVARGPSRFSPDSISIEWRN